MDIGRGNPEWVSRLRDEISVRYSPVVSIIDTQSYLEYTKILELRFFYQAQGQKEGLNFWCFKRSIWQENEK